jgi:hypothetical protein
MDTLIEFYNEVRKMRSVLNLIEVKGEDNAARIVACAQMCSALEKDLMEAAKNSEPGPIELQIVKPVQGSKEESV